MKNKTTKNNTSKRNILRKLTHRSKLLKEVLRFNRLTIITEELEKNNNKLKRLVQSINYKKGETNTIYLPR